MARSFDHIVKDGAGYIRLNGLTGTVLFRIIETPIGKAVHIKLRSNCRQVEQRGDPDFYIPLAEFEAVLEQDIDGEAFS